MDLERGGCIQTPLNKGPKNKGLQIAPQRLQSPLDPITRQGEVSKGMQSDPSHPPPWQSIPSQNSHTWDFAISSTQVTENFKDCKFYLQYHLGRQRKLPESWGSAFPGAAACPALGTGLMQEPLTLTPQGCCL